MVMGSQSTLDHGPTMQPIVVPAGVVDVNDNLDQHGVQQLSMRRHLKRPSLIGHGQEATTETDIVFSDDDDIMKVTQVGDL